MLTAIHALSRPWQGNRAMSPSRNGRGMLLIIKQHNFGAILRCACAAHATPVALFSCALTCNSPH